MAMNGLYCAAARSLKD